MLWNRAAIATTIALIAADAILIPPLVIIYLRRRHLQPIKARCPIVFLVIIILFEIKIICDFIAIIHPLPCVVKFTTQCLTLTATAFNVVRCAHLHWSYQITRARMLLQGIRVNSGLKLSTIIPIGADSTRDHLVSLTRASMTPRDHWFLTHAWIISWRFLFKICMVIVAAHVVLILASITDYTLYPNRDCLSSPTMQSVYLTWISVILIVELYFILRIRVVTDSFFIRWELISCWFVRIANTLVFVSPQMIVWSYEVFPFIVVIYWCVMKAFVSIGLAIPIRWSYRFADDLLNPVPITFDRILGMEAGVAALTLFLAEEFCVETISFLVAVRNYRSAFEPDLHDSSLPSLHETIRDNVQRLVSYKESSRMSKTESYDVSMVTSSKPINNADTTLVSVGNHGKLAVEIFAAYIKRDAAMAINISSTTYERIDDALAKGLLTKRLFDGAYGEIQALLIQGPYPRFFRSDYAQKFLSVG